MKTFVARLILVLLAAFFGTAGACIAQTAAPPPSKVALADLSFIVGSWGADWSGGFGEEHWSTASGDSMVGTFRFVKEGKARFYEMMLIEQTPEGPVLRLKHFNPGLIGWEEKAQVYSYPLIEHRQGLAVFERPDKQTRMTFRRTSNDSLSVLLEQTKDGKQTSEEFKFKLLK
jgi:hypothetical protein